MVPAGVITGDDVRKVFLYAREHQFAIPAFNCTSTSTINAALEAARESQSPVIIQVNRSDVMGFYHDLFASSLFHSIVHQLSLVFKRRWCLLCWKMS